MTTKQTLLPRNEAFKRYEQKLNDALMFLRIERWSHQKILQKKLGLKSRQAIHKTLVKFEKNGAIRRYQIEDGFTHPLTIWGITPHGVMLSFHEGEEITDIRAFEPSKVKPSQVNHTLDIQQARVKAELAGWTNWDYAGFSKKGLKNPDAIATRPDGKVVAIEIERTLKSFRRYPDVLVSHLAARKQGCWDEIYYLMPDKSMKRKVERIFASIDKARYQNQTIQISDEHKAPFKFFTYDENWEFLQKEI